MILIYYKTWIYQCLIKQVKSPSTWSRVPNSVPIRHSGWAGNRGVTIDQICQDCKLEILGILFTVDLRVMDISDFDVIFGMDWLTAHRVVIDCDSRRITAYTWDGIHVTFQGEKHDALPQIVHDSRWS